MTLSRRTPLRAKPRAKGNRGELAVRNLIREFPAWRGARRNWMSGGQGGGDIIEGPIGVHVESKWQERCCIWEWIAQAEAEARPTDIPAVFVRDNAHPVWWVVAPSDEIEALCELDPLPSASVNRHLGTTHLWRWIDMADHNRSVAYGNRPARAIMTFSRDGAAWYSAIEAREFLRLVYIREQGT